MRPVKNRHLNAPEIVMAFTIQKDVHTPQL